MRKIDGYIIKKFLGSFFASIALIIIIVVVFDISEKLDKFLEKDVSLHAIVWDYYVNFIPYFINMFSSLFLFIAVIFFTSRLAQGHASASPPKHGGNPCGRSDKPSCRDLRGREPPRRRCHRHLQRPRSFCDRRNHRRLHRR